MKYRIAGGQLIVGDRILKADLLINGDKIEGILASDAPHAPSYTVIDAHGLYVSPGFVDIHQHGGGGADYMDADTDTYRRATEAHLAHGMTSVMPTLLSADTDALLRAIEAYKQAAADPAIRVNLIGLHIEGPYISPSRQAHKSPSISVIIKRMNTVPSSRLPMGISSVGAPLPRLRVPMPLPHLPRSKVLH